MAAAAPEPAIADPGPPPGPYCRNCGTLAGGAFCPACGQETRIALPTARQFLKDAAGRYVALDGRTWRTLHALLFRPGFLTREYFAGRRRRYIRPSRLFLVLSLAMFATLRLVVGVPQVDEGAVLFETDEPKRAVPGVPGGAPAAAPADPGPRTGTTAAEAPRKGTAAAARDEVVVLMPGAGLRLDEHGNFHVDGSGRVASLLRQRTDRFNALPRQERIEQVVLGMVRYGPYAMFVLLPAFALLLMLLYAGRRRHYPARPSRYAEHLVFAAHNHAFVFALVTLAIVAQWAPLGLALALWAAIYGLWSMKAVYGGRWLGVIARAWTMAVAYLVLFGFVTLGLLLAALLVR